MKASLKHAARRLLSAPPARSLLRARALRGRPVSVLCYHTLGPDRGGPDAWTLLRETDFRAHLKLLAAHYDIVSLDDALAIGPGPADRTERPLAVLTFDDGEAGLARYLLPILADEGHPATVYVATAQIESGRPYWFDRTMAALGEGAREVSLPGLGDWRLPAAPGPVRWAVLSDLLETLKRVAPREREALADRVVADHPLPPGRPPIGPLTRDELATLAASPLVTIGAHSHCHNLLDQLDAGEAADSMARSRRLLQDWTGREVAHFAWPNGNHTPALRRIAESQGFRTAAALDNKLWRRGADLFALPRLAIARYDDPARLSLRLAEL